MKVPFFNTDYPHQLLKDEIHGAFQRVMDRGVFINGPEVGLFEQQFGAYHGQQVSAVCCGNGTQALELILRAFAIGPGDEVILPALTCFASAEPVVAVGARPVFADILSGEKTIDPEAVKQKITKATKAIIVVHLYGLPARMDELKEIAQVNHLFLIEDCAQGHGATFRGKPVGTFGHAAAYSFYPTKNLGSLGDGGAVLTTDEQIANKVRIIRDHGQTAKDLHVLSGMNSRMDELQAAVLSVKLSKLDVLNEMRKTVAGFYRNRLCAHAEKPPNESGHVFHQYVVEVGDREKLMEYLTSNGIHAAIHYPYLVPHTPAFSINERFPVAERAIKRILSLPVFPGISKDMRSHVAEKINAFYAIGEDND